MILKRLAVGALGANCYIVGCEKEKTGMVIDPGGDAGRIISEISNLGLKIKTIILTHGHGDHIGAANAVKSATGAEIAIHADDIGVMQDKVLCDMFGLDYNPVNQPDILLKGGDMITVGELKFTVIHTPGHSRGGICLFGEGVLFSGDTLFSGSIGRTDLARWGGDYNTIIKSIKTKLLTLDDATIVYPGHGPKTTIGDERRGNPFLI
jgi:glyoxylase-like metal-dependent hydrolase (beta-lactamase superfamily II)